MALVPILNWSFTLSFFHASPVWKRLGSHAVASESESEARRGEAVEQASGVSDEKRVFLEIFGEVYGYPESSCPIDKLRATEFARLNGMQHEADSNVSSGRPHLAIFKALISIEIPLLKIIFPCNPGVISDDFQFNV